MMDALACNCLKIPEPYPVWPKLSKQGPNSHISPDHDPRTMFGCPGIKKDTRGGEGLILVCQERIDHCIKLRLPVIDGFMDVCDFVTAFVDDTRRLSQLLTSPRRVKTRCTRLSFL